MSQLNKEKTVAVINEIFKIFLELQVPIYQRNYILQIIMDKNIRASGISWEDEVKKEKLPPRTRFINEK